MIALGRNACEAQGTTDIYLLLVSHIIVLDKYSFFEYHLIPPNRITKRISQRKSKCGDILIPTQ